MSLIHPNLLAYLGKLLFLCFVFYCSLLWIFSEGTWCTHTIISKSMMYMAINIKYPIYTSQESKHCLQYAFSIQIMNNLWVLNFNRMTSHNNFFSVLRCNAILVIDQVLTNFGVILSMIKVKDRLSINYSNKTCTCKFPWARMVRSLI